MFVLTSMPDRPDENNAATTAFAVAYMSEEALGSKI